MRASPDKEEAAREGRPQSLTTTASTYTESTTAAEAAVQESLEDYRRTFAEQARDTGMQAAASNDAEWAERVLDWLYDLAPGVSVSADDVRREFGSSCAMGSVFRTAAHRRVLQAVGLKESTAVSRHKGLQRVWRRT